MMRARVMALMMALMLIWPIAAQCEAQSDASNDSPIAEATADARPMLLYFFENYCDSCKPEQDFINTFPELTGKQISDYQYRYYNVRMSAGREAYEQALAQYDVPEDERYLPMAIVDGHVSAGSSRIEGGMPADFLENESTDSVIYYLYSPSCEGCAAAKGTLDALPESLKVKRGMYEFDSRVELISVNIYEQLDTAKALFERYGVPEDEQTTPIVFLGDTYLRGAERINMMLNYMLENAQAVGTPLIAASPGKGAGSTAGADTLTWAGTFTAGLVAGFNPCALSMLLFFLTLLLPLKKHAGLYSSIYLMSKFVMYMLIGTVLLTAFSAWNPTWLPLFAKLLLTAIGGVLIVLNLWDAWSARREKYGQIRNQLPRGVRHFLHERIKRALEHPGRGLIPSIVLLGLIVAASEFLCSGQLYLATLTAGLEMGIGYMRQLMMLAVFCIAFLLPSIALTLLVIKGRDMFKLSDAMLRHMPAIKLATALVMAAIIAVAWII